MRLSRPFFERPTLQVAKELIGKQLVFQDKKGLITETEAYFGFDDPASHAYRGQTPRNRVMFGPAGFSYIYFIYGMYYCLNVTTQEEGFPAAVLIRGLLLPNGLHLNGPGKLCREMALSTAYTGQDMTLSEDFYFEDVGQTFPVQNTTRIGLKQGTDLKWRYVAKLKPKAKARQ